MVLLQSMTIDTVFHKSGLGNMKDSLKRYKKLLFLFVVSEKIAVAHQICQHPACHLIIRNAYFKIFIIICSRPCFLD